MKRCPQCNQRYSDEYQLCSWDSTRLVGDSADETTVIRPARVTPLTQRPVRQGVHPLFAYLSIGLLALVAGGAIVAWVQSGTSAPANSSPPKTEPSITAARPTPEKTSETKKEAEAPRSRNVAAAPPVVIVQQVPAPASPRTYRVVNVPPTEPLFIRSKPHHKEDEVGRIPYDGIGVQVLGGPVPVGKGRWVKVSYAGTTGWVNFKYLTPE